ncbi:MAG: signal peptidase I [bacterium]
MKANEIDLLLFKECLGKNEEMPLYPNGLSMEPFINTKGKIAIEKTKPQEIKKGDIVVFHPDKNARQMRVHRVIKIYKKNGKHLFLIKGDACFLEDGFIPPKRIIGKVTSIIKGNKRLEFNTVWMRLFNYLLSIYSFITWYGHRYIIKRILIPIKNPMIKKLLFRIAWIAMIDIPKLFIGILLIFTRMFSEDIVKADKCISMNQ